MNEEIRGWGLCMHHIWYAHEVNMKDIKYKIKGIRMNEKTWKKLKEKRKKSKLSWNLFLLELIEKK